MAAEALDCILDGLEAELELARELGVCSIEIDRSLLAADAPDVRVAPRTAAPSVAPFAAPPPRLAPAPREASVEPSAPADGTDPALALAFLHDKPLSPAGVEMMAKIVAALKLPDGAAQVVVAPPRPRAKVYIVLGARALKRWFPALAGAPGQWLRTETGEDLLVTYSPEYILRFTTVTPAVKKIKVDMWTAIKSVLRRV